MGPAPRSRRALATVLLALAAARATPAANVPVRYLVDCTHFLQAGPRLQRWVTVELYASPTCNRPALTEQYAAVEAVAAPATRRQPPTLVLEADLAIDAPPSEVYLRVTGPGVKAHGDVCQRAPGDVPLARRCPPDAVSSNGLCVDRYEATLWEIPATRIDLICKVIDGTAVPSDLSGIRQIGFPGPPFGHAAVPGTFLAEGAYAVPVYAASLPGVLPSTYLSAYQAWAACGFSGKRLPTSDEWTAAASGTPSDSSHDAAEDCNTGAGVVSAGVPVPTGSRSRCVSRAGAFDMVGNVSEWTMDGHSRTRYRGGAWDAGDGYGIAFTQPDVPLTQDNAVGFRCVR